MTLGYMMTRLMFSDSVLGMLFVTIERPELFPVSVAVLLELMAKPVLPPAVIHVHSPFGFL
jgi:hypothetical protein